MEEGLLKILAVCIPTAIVNVIIMEKAKAEREKDYFRITFFDRIWLFFENRKMRKVK